MDKDKPTQQFVFLLALLKSLATNWLLPKTIQGCNFCFKFRSQMTRSNSICLQRHTECLFSPITWPFGAASSGAASKVGKVSCRVCRIMGSTVLQRKGYRDASGIERYRKISKERAWLFSAKGLWKAWTIRISGDCWTITTVRILQNVAGFTISCAPSCGTQTAPWMTGYGSSRPVLWWFLQL